jgi:hypothetical protein
MSGMGTMHERGPLPMLGGAVIAASGLTQVLSGLQTVADNVSPSPSVPEALMRLAIVAGSALIIVGVIAVAGGVYALYRKKLAVALIGGVLTTGVAALATLTTLYGVYTLSLGLVGVILLVGGREEFID